MNIWPVLQKFWPYFIFAALAILYNIYTLGDGFSASLDEGFLLTSGQRIAGGQVPFRDFDFFRTPLSIYLQGAGIGLFGDHYTVLLARSFWALEMLVLAFLLTTLYRKYVNRVELLLLLIASYITFTMLFAFPWYNYDALFLGVAAVILLKKEKFILCGIALFLAGMAKQSYFLLLPLCAGFTLLLFPWRHEISAFRVRPIVRILIGFGSIAAAYVLFLLAQGNLGAFIDNVFLLPAKCYKVGLSFTIFQNNPQAFKDTFPLLVAVGLLFIADHKKWPLWGVMLAIVYFWGGYVLHDYVYRYVHFTVFLNYTIAVLVLVMVLKNEGSDNKRLTAPVYYFGLSLIIQYLSGFNLSGLSFASLGSGIALPFAYVLFRDCSPSKMNRIGAYIVVCTVIYFGAYHKYHFVYHQPQRKNLTEEFTTPKLKGIKSDPKNVAHIDKMLNLIENNTDSTDFIFTFPNYPSLYYLSDRRNPTRVDWYYSYLQEQYSTALDDLNIRPPKVIFMDSSRIRVELRDLINRQYDLLDSTREIYVYKLRDSVYSMPEN